MGAIGKFVGRGAIAGLATLAGLGIFDAARDHFHERNTMAAARKAGTLAPDKVNGTFAANQASIAAGLEKSNVPTDLSKTFAKAYEAEANHPTEKGNNGITYLAVQKGPAEVWAQVIHNPVKGGPSTHLQSVLCYSLNGVVQQEFKPNPVSQRFEATETQSFIKGGCDKRLTYQQGNYRLNKVTISSPSA